MHAEPQRSVYGSRPQNDAKDHPAPQRWPTCVPECSTEYSTRHCCGYLGYGLVISYVSSPEDLYNFPGERFPTALEAAVASNQSAVLSNMFTYLMVNVRGKPAVTTWDEVRRAARCVENALQVAVRLHNASASDILFDFLADNAVFRHSTSKDFGDQLVRNSMRCGNMDLILGAFAYRQCGSYN